MNADHINSFVGKFMTLWSSGSQVSLKLNAVNGKAKVILELDLEECQSQSVKSYENYDSMHVPPSRQRCREKKYHETFNSIAVKDSGSILPKVDSETKDEMDNENIDEVLPQKKVYQK